MRPCYFCGKPLRIGYAPPPGDLARWREIRQEHHPACPWVEARGFIEPRPENRLLDPEHKLTVKVMVPGRSLQEVHTWREAWELVDEAGHPREDFRQECLQPARPTGEGIPSKRLGVWLLRPIPTPNRVYPPNNGRRKRRMSA